MTLAKEVDGVDNIYNAEEIPDPVDYPYQTLTEVSKGRGTFCGDVWQHETIVQFTFYGLDNAIETTVKNFFDYVQDNVSGLSVVGYSVLQLQNQFGSPGIQRFGDVFQDSIDFTVTILKNK